MNFLTKIFTSNARVMGARSVTTISWTDMGKSKHDFVHFVNAAVSNKHGVEALELHKFLNKVFIDNDYNYDGLVGRVGFDQMVKEAAHAPRRFGFAPHSSEMYDSAEAEEAAHSKLFDQLCGGDGISFESWYKWSMDHIISKDVNLKEHHDSRWERSADDFVSFFKGVAKASSAHCLKSSSSTQYKEFYLMTNQHFVAADSENLGYLCEAGFDRLLAHSAEIPHRFGHEWYTDVKFSDVAVGGQVTWHGWLAFNTALVKKHAASL
jgi:hypothetical protein